IGSGVRLFMDVRYVYEVRLSRFFGYSMVGSEDRCEWAKNRGHEIWKDNDFGCWFLLAYWRVVPQTVRGLQLRGARNGSSTAWPPRCLFSMRPLEMLVSC